MKVLFFVRDLKAASVTFIRTQITLVQQRHEVLVVSIGHQPQYMVDTIPCVGIPFQDSYWTNRPMRRLAKWDLFYGFFNPIFGKRLTQVVAEFNPDIIHCQFGTDGIIFLDHFPNAEKVPVFIQFRGYDASFMYGKKSYRRRLRRYFGYSWIHPIYVSQNQYDRTVKLKIFPDKKRILYSCTDTDFFPFRPRTIISSKSEFKFLQVGRMVEKKGHEFTLLAFQQLVLFLASIGSKATLKFVGGGPLIDSLRKKSEELGLTDHVRFSDSVIHSKVNEFLQESDYFLHPSITTSDGEMEGLPNAIMEALAVGVPVIATQHSGMEELMCPQGSLFLVEEKNVLEYSKVMIQLVLGELQFDPEKSRKMIENKFSTHQHIAQLLAFYRGELSPISLEKNFG